MKRLNVTSCMVSLLVLIVSTELGMKEVSGHTLSAPSTVYADEEGEFLYRFTVTVTHGAAWSVVGWTSDANVRGWAQFDDCYCIECLQEPGSEVYYDVSGHLKNPLYPGTVENWIIFCGEDSTLNSFTTIMPSRPTDSVPATWGRIKAFYRR